MEPFHIDHHREYLSPPHLGFKVRSPWGHPGSRGSFCLLDRRGEKEAPLELCQVFEVTVTLISGLVKLVFSCQTYTWALCLKCAANKPGFKTESKQYALRMQRKSSLIHQNKSSAFYCWGTWDNPKRISWPSWKHRGESSCGSDSKDCPIRNSLRVKWTKISTFFILVQLSWSKHLWDIRNQKLLFFGPNLRRAVEKIVGKSILWRQCWSGEKKREIQHSVFRVDLAQKLWWFVQP